MKQTPQQHADAVLLLSTKITDLVAATAPTHAAALEALLGAFQAIAVTHACCTEQAGASAIQVGSWLISHSLQPMHGQSLH